mgnify:CR=1 FL=1
MSYVVIQKGIYTIRGCTCTDIEKGVKCRFLNYQKPYCVLFEKNLEETVYEKDICLFGLKIGTDRSWRNVHRCSDCLDADYDKTYDELNEVAKRKTPEGWERVVDFIQDGDMVFSNNILAKNGHFFLVDSDSEDKDIRDLIGRRIAECREEYVIRKKSSNGDV